MIVSQSVRRGYPQEPASLIVPENLPTSDEIMRHRRQSNEGQMLTMMHHNVARVERGSLFIDRKFHLGMQNYVAAVAQPIVSIHPESDRSEMTMDMVEVPLTELGYSVIAINRGSDATKAIADASRMVEQIRASQLVYGGGLGSEAICTDLKIPQIAVLEYDFATQIKISTSYVVSPLRKAARAMKVSIDHVKNIGNLRRSVGINCNGYPVFDATAKYNSNRVLYLDSRMYQSLVISREALEARLLRPSAAPLKLLFSGRYDPIKGALDAVRVGLACLEQGLDVELHCYGQGIQRDEMSRLASQPSARDRIHIHDAVTYPELVEIARDFDIFVCCHVQADPSCTYLESFGSGLPIVGYANTMWRRLSEESQAGLCSPLNNPQRVVDDIKRLTADVGLRNALSRRARDFALAHAFEPEFKLRTDDINRMLDLTRASSNP